MYGVCWPNLTLNPNLHMSNIPLNWEQTVMYITGEFQQTIHTLSHYSDIIVTNCGFTQLCSLELTTLQ